MNEKQYPHSFDQQGLPFPQSEAVFDTASSDRHICLFYKNRDEQWHMMCPYLVGILKAGLPVVYVQDRTSQGRLRELLGAEGLPVDDLIDRDLLRIVPIEQVYLLTGRFDFQRVLAFMESTILDLQASGYDHMFITGETRWWLPSIPGVERWMNYESQLNPLVEKYPGATIVCQYDLTRFDAPTMLNLLLTHQSIHLPGGRVPGYYAQ